MTMLLLINCPAFLSGPFLQYLAQIVRGLHVQFLAYVCPRTVDIALLLAENGADVVQLLVLQNQTADFTFGGGEFREKRFHF